MVHKSIETNIKEIDEPLNYFLSLGGKRLRPAMVYLLEKWYDQPIAHVESESVAKSVEFFHNFSLIHDDIMDDADLRRGKETIHTKWNQNISILSGDYLLIEAYKQLEALPQDVLLPIFSLYNQTAAEVCIGQQMDMNFESLEQVAQTDYIEMIRLKTAVLLGFVMKATGELLRLPKTELQTLYAIGQDIGISFQILDDVLDTFGTEQVGKTIGGDILQSKKTILFTLVCDSLNGQAKADFISLYHSDDADKVSKVVALMQDLDIKAQAEKLADTYTQRVHQDIASLSMPEGSKAEFVDFVQQLLNREY